ncbi:hypothetical protein QE152_g10258 [Popillia japonica]|uniref:Platelet-derived growth factor (PDGF) family profile domain-containing protein n=1 Tax=Popillia japonica TaxID=7064 RepID=A0AAW1LW51_POPJA
MLPIANISLIVLVCVLISVQCCAAKLDSFAIWKAQKAATQEFKCQPRPRSFLASNIIDELEGDNDIIPWETVLHRCDSHSGCCENRGVCTETPDGIEVVKLAFFSHKIQDIVVFEAKNHTRCSCQKENSSTIK